MISVGKAKSRLIENGEQVMLDATDALLVDEVAVIAGTGTEHDSVAIELHGRVTRSEEEQYVLAMLDVKEASKMIRMLVAGVLDTNDDVVASDLWEQIDGAFDEGLRRRGTA